METEQVVEPIDQEPEDKEARDAIALKAADQSTDYVSKYWDNHQQATAPRRQRLADWYKQYRGIPNRKSYDGFANVVVNETLEACESITAQEVRNLFADHRYVMLLPKEETDKRKAFLNEALLQDSLDKIGHKSKLIRQLRQKNKYGTTWAKVFMDHQSKDIITKKSGGQFVKTVVRNCPNYHYLDILDQIGR